MVSQWFGGTYKEPIFFARFAAEPDRLFTVYPEIHLPEDQKKAFQRERTACIVHKAIAEKYNMHSGDRIVIKGDIFPWLTSSFILRGIFDGTDAEAMYFNLEYLFQSLPAGMPRFCGNVRRTGP